MSSLNAHAEQISFSNTRENFLLEVVLQIDTISLWIKEREVRIVGGIEMMIRINRAFRDNKVNTMRLHFSGGAPYVINDIDVLDHKDPICMVTTQNGTKTLVNANKIEFAELTS